MRAFPFLFSEPAALHAEGHLRLFDAHLGVALDRLGQEGVAADDHVGHGKTALENNTWGDWGHQGFHTMMEDEHQLKALVCELYPNLPYFLYGHSMGSMIARDFMTKYGEELSGVTLCGTCGVFPIAEETIAKIDRLIDAGQGDAADPELGGELLGWMCGRCGEIKIDEEAKVFELGGYTFHEGDYISLDGSTGNIYDGIIPTVPATIAGEFGRIMGWADKFRTMKVRTNADTPADAKKARELGAEGIGLCRTEHMFFEGDRIDAFREMICSETVEEREAALAKILPEQQGDFEKLYEALEGNPVTIRFLDPPLHEFVPTEEEDIKKLADAQGKTVEQIKAIIDSLHEFNPMMGHRGCRLAVTYPEIAKMQTTAVIRAAINVKKAHPDWAVKPEIMIPLVGDIKELKYVKKFVVETADAEIAAAGSDLQYEVGTMIEIPRAALTADDIAKEADFFCFGTNDLTQMTYGFSRDDAGKFLDAYYDAKIFENDPFAKLDQVGVGKLMKMAIELGKPVNPKLHVGICGEHGGDPSSVEFCNSIGLDYVSCSPFRVPIARLAAAQAAIKSR